MEFFYQSGAMGFDGKGYKWHKWFGYKFPKFPVISKTITLKPRKGHPLWVIPYKNSIWNKVGLHNPGLDFWLKNYYNKDIILSLYFDNKMDFIEFYYNILGAPYNLSGVELNVSCPNVADNATINYPNIDFYLYKLFALKQKKYIDKIYLKVNSNYSLYNFNNLVFVDRIHLNSVGKVFGAVSGASAKKNNWSFIEKWQGKTAIPNIAGCSWSSIEDISTLKGMGCDAIGIGSTILTNPKLVERLSAYELT